MRTSASVVYIYPIGIVISYGVGFTYYTVTGSPEPQLNNKLEFPRLFLLLSSGNLGSLTSFL